MNERKEAYLYYLDPEWKEDDNRQINVRTRFKLVEQYEELVGKDASEWNAKEIISYYKSLCTPSVDFLYNIHSVFKKYTTWCLQENLLADNINHYEEVTIDTLLQCINKTVANKRIISRTELLNEIRKLVNPRDKFMCLACFEGLIGKGFEDMLNVKLSDFKDGYVKRFSKAKPIRYSNELLSFAHEAVEENIYYISKRQYKMIGEEDQVVKKVLSRDIDTGDTTVTAQVVMTKLKDIQKETNNPAFTSKALKESGRIHMIKTLMASDKEMTLPKAIQKTFDTYGIVLSIPAYINKYNDFLK